MVKAGSWVSKLLINGSFFLKSPVSRRAASSGTSRAFQAGVAGIALQGTDVADPSHNQIYDVGQPRDTQLTPTNKAASICRPAEHTVSQD